VSDQGAEALAKPPRRLPISLAAMSPTPIVIGIVLCAVGFVLIAYCWSQVGLRMAVADQVPYIVSAGFTGMGLILVGAMIVSIQVRRRDAEQQFRRLEQLVFAGAGQNTGRSTRRSGSQTVDELPLDSPNEGEEGVVAKTRALRDPVRAAFATSVLAVLAGFALIGFAWFRASDEMDVAVQVPYVVSGGLAGLALVAVGAVLAHVLFSRGLENERGNVIADVVAAVGGKPPKPPRVSDGRRGKR
jgi:hypothetical protein